MQNNMPKINGNQQNPKQFEIFISVGLSDECKVTGDEHV